MHASSYIPCSLSSPTCSLPRINLLFLIKNMKFRIQKTPFLFLFLKKNMVFMRVYEIFLRKNVYFAILFIDYRETI